MTTQVHAPVRSLEQRTQALGKANRVRLERAQLKRDLHAHRMTLADVLASPPEFIESMKVFDLLMATPKVGRVRTSRALARAGMSPSKTVAGMTDRQREDLLGTIGGWR